MNAWSEVGKKFLAAGQKVSDKTFLSKSRSSLRSFRENLFDVVDDKNKFRRQKR